MYTKITPGKKHCNELYQFYNSSESGKTSSSYLFECVEKYSKKSIATVHFSIQSILQKECLIKTHFLKNFDFFVLQELAST